MEKAKEWDEVVALDGCTYRASREPHSSADPLPLTDSELKSIDAAIRKLVDSARFRDVRVGGNIEMLKRIDSLISDSLIELKQKVKVEPAEKLFDRLMAVIYEWEDLGEVGILAALIVRFIDTMEYMVSYKAKFRGVVKDRVRYGKKEAFRELKARGLTRK